MTVNRVIDAVPQLMSRNIQKWNKKSWNAMYLLPSIKWLVQSGMVPTVTRTSATDRETMKLLVTLRKLRMRQNAMMTNVLPNKETKMIRIRIDDAMTR